MSTRKRTPSAAAIAGKLEQSAAARLAADPGPLLLAVAINRVTGKATISDSSAGDHDLALLDEALRAISAQIQAKRIKLAEARGGADQNQ